MLPLCSCTYGCKTRKLLFQVRDPENDLFENDPDKIRRKRHSNEISRSFCILKPLSLGRRSNHIKIHGNYSIFANPRKLQAFNSTMPLLGDMWPISSLFLLSSSTVFEKNAFCPHETCGALLRVQSSIIGFRPSANVTYQ
jgi:hypothetical protein